MGILNFVLGSKQLDQSKKQHEDDLNSKLQLADKEFDFKKQLADKEQQLKLAFEQQKHTNQLVLNRYDFHLKNGVDPENAKAFAVAEGNELADQELKRQRLDTLVKNKHGEEVAAGEHLKAMTTTNNEGELLAQSNARKGIGTTLGETELTNADMTKRSVQEKSSKKFPERQAELESNKLGTDLIGSKNALNQAIDFTTAGGPGLETARLLQLGRTGLSAAPFIRAQANEFMYDPSTGSSVAFAPSTKTQTTGPLGQPLEQTKPPAVVTDKRALSTTNPVVQAYLEQLKRAENSINGIGLEPNVEPVAENPPSNAPVTIDPVADARRQAARNSILAMLGSVRQEGLNERLKINPLLSNPRTQVNSLVQVPISDPYKLMDPASNINATNARVNAAATAQQRANAAAERARGLQEFINSLDSAKDLNTLNDLLANKPKQSIL